MKKQTAVVFGLILTATLLYFSPISSRSSWKEEPVAISSQKSEAAKKSNSLTSSNRKLTEKDGDTLHVDDSVYNGVKKLLFFVGHERSCHSFVGSVVDAHPHMILATKYNPLWVYYDHPRDFPTKEDFFYKLMLVARQHGVRYKADAKGYSLIVDPRYQGIFEGDLQVIGSQRAAPVSDLYRKYPNEFEKLISHIKEVVGIPVYFIRVIRNPYDNIATGVIFQEMSKKEFVEMKEQQLTGTLEEKHIPNKSRVKNFTVDYFSRMKASVGVLKTSDKYLDVYCDRLIADPKKVISDMCKFLEVECSKDYIETCASKVFTEESSTRKLMMWPKDILKYIADVGSEYPNLSRFVSAGVD